MEQSPACNISNMDAIATRHRLSPPGVAPPSLLSPSKNPLTHVWTPVAQVVDASLDPSPTAHEIIARSSLAELHAALYSVCAVPPAASFPPQPQYVYALLRAQLHVHAQAVACLVAEALDLPATFPAAHGMHLVQQDNVVQRTNHLRESLQECGLWPLEKDAALSEPKFISSASEVPDNESKSVVSADRSQAVLGLYARCWTAYLAGLECLTSLFYYLDHVWIPGRACDGLCEEDVVALGPENAAVHDVRTTALLAWDKEVLLPLGESICHAVLSVIALERDARICNLNELHGVQTHDASAPAVENRYTGFKAGPDEGLDALWATSTSDSCVVCVAPVVESICEVGRTAAHVNKPVASFFDAHEGLPSTATSGLSPSAAFADPLRVPLSERAAHVLFRYRNLFEGPFLAEIAQFYSERSRAMLASRVCVRDYVRIVGELLETEINLVKSYCDDSTVEPLRAVLEKALVSDHADSLLAEADVMLRGLDGEDLRHLYVLLSRIPDSLAPLHALLRSHIVSVGLSALRPWCTYDAFSSESHRSWMQQLAGLKMKSWSDSQADTEEKIARCAGALPDSAACSFVCCSWHVYDQFMSITKTAFENDREFTNALEQGCERFLNSVPSAAELLAECCHQILENQIYSLTSDPSTHAASCASRSSSSSGTHHSLSEHERAEWLTRVTRLFRFLNDSDGFQCAYAAKLTRRLIHRTSVSQSLEETMLNLLKETCGCDYTSRLLRMFTDVSISASETARFEQSLSGHDRSVLCDFAIDRNVDVLVLSSSAWTSLSQCVKREAVQTTESGEDLSDSADQDVLSRTTHASALSSASRARKRCQSSVYMRESCRLLGGWGMTSSSGGSSDLTRLHYCEGKDKSDENSDTDVEDLSRRALQAISAPLGRVSELFTDFYANSNSRHAERTLWWQYHLSRVEIAAHLGETQEKTILLEASLPQAAVLLQFIDDCEVTVQHLACSLGLSLSEIESIVGVLLRAGLLQCEQREDAGQGERMGGTAFGVDVSSIELDSVLRVNNDFSVCHCRRNESVSLALLSYEVDRQIEVKRDYTAINTDRRQQLKACIVRVMKQCKYVEEADLVRRVCDDMARWFVVREGDVISSIASLVDNEYITYNGSTCVYVA